MRVVEIEHHVSQDWFKITLRPCWLARVFGAPDLIMRVHRTEHGFLRASLSGAAIESVPHGRLALGALGTMPKGVYVTIGYAGLSALRPGVPVEGPT